LGVCLIRRRVGYGEEAVYGTLRETVVETANASPGSSSATEVSPQTQPPGSPKRQPSNGTKQPTPYRPAKTVSSRDAAAEEAALRVAQAKAEAKRWERVAAMTSGELAAAAAKEQTEACASSEPASDTKPSVSSTKAETKRYPTPMTSLKSAVVAARELGEASARVSDTADTKPEKASHTKQSASSLKAAKKRAAKGRKKEEREREERSLAAERQREHAEVWNAVWYAEYAEKMEREKAAARSA
jgi:hypothetical protein